MKTGILVDFAWGIGIVLVALAAKFANAQGYIDSDTMLRVVAMNGLMIAWYGNRMPKTVAPSIHARQVTRFAGWVFVISGLVYAGFWAFAPIQQAMIFGTGAVAAGVILTLGYCFGLRTQSRTAA